MKARPVADIAFDILMTIKAKRPLSRSVERFVTGRTLRLHVSMTMHDVSGHNQRLNSLSSGSVAHEAGKHRNKSS